MHIAILDDERYFSEKIKQLIRKEDNIDLFEIDIYEHASDFIQNKDKYDLLFLDIDMPEINGIEIAKQLKRDNIIIVFVTNFQEYMAEAFGVNVAAFIIKDKLEVSFKKIFREVIEYVNQNQTITINQNHRVYHLSLLNILYFEYNKKHLYAYMEKEVVDLGYLSVKEIIKSLPAQFILVNKNQIINVYQIVSMKGTIVKLKDCDTPIEVSRRKVDEVFELLTKIMDRV